jgi:hypothetical protein
MNGHDSRPEAEQASLTRRTLIGAFAVTSAAMAFRSSAQISADSPASAELAARAHDWDWLVGNWDVWHRRLKERLVASNEWEEFTGKSVLWRTLEGFGTLDDNVLDLPGGRYYGATIRAHDGRNPTTIEPPVTGTFEDDTGTFIGKDTLKGRPITVRFRWRDIHGARPWWEQAFSVDGGVTWEVNWRNYFTRTSATPAPLAVTQGSALRELHDWDFIVGSWAVHNRRLKGLAGTKWEEFGSTLVNRPILAGLGNVGDNKFDAPDGSYCGVSIRSFDPQTRQWLSRWLDGRSPSIGAATRGSFENGVGTLIGNDSLHGRAIKVRSQWSRITPSSAHWEQAISMDGGTTWQTNWVSDFTRKA